MLAHEIGHAVGLGHSGDATFWNRSSDFPTMSHAATINSDAAQTIEADDAGGASWSRSDGPDMWSANAGFEDGLLFWSTVGVVSAGTGSSFSGSKRALLSSGGEVRTTVTYDPWNPEAHDTYDGMVANLANAPITLRGQVIDNNASSGNGEVELWVRYREFEYPTYENYVGPQNDPPGDLVVKNAGDAQGVGGGWTSWSKEDSVAPSQSWRAISWEFDQLLLLQRTDQNSTKWVEGVQIWFKVVNDHNSKVRLDEVGLFGGGV